MSDYDELGAHILKRIDEFNKRESELDQLRALARRVHAECGPYQIGMSGWFVCKCDVRAKESLREVVHSDNCLWLAADALLRKAAQ